MTANTSATIEAGNFWLDLCSLQAAHSARWACSVSPSLRRPALCVHPARLASAYLELRISSCFACCSWEAGCMSATVVGLLPGSGTLQGMWKPGSV